MSVSKCNILENIDHFVTINKNENANLPIFGIILLECHHFMIPGNMLLLYKVSQDISHQLQAWLNILKCFIENEDIFQENHDSDFGHFRNEAKTIFFFSLDS